MYRLWGSAFVSISGKAVLLGMPQSNTAKMYLPLSRECGLALIPKCVMILAPGSIQVWIQSLIVGLSLKTLVIYRFYIIYIFYNPYLLLIIIIIPSPLIQFPAIQRIKKAIRALVHADIWEYYLKDDDNGDNAQNRLLKPRLSKGFRLSPSHGLWGILDTGRIESGQRNADRIATIGISSNQDNYHGLEFAGEAVGLPASVIRVWTTVSTASLMFKWGPMA